MNDRHDIEREWLGRTLETQRNHVLSVVSGLDEQLLRTATLPSAWTPIGLVRHLTFSEKYWFHTVVGGNPLDWRPQGARGDWHVGAEEATVDVIEAYRSQVATSNSLIDSTGVDDPPRWRDPVWEQWGVDFPSLRAVLLHTITETATHAGQLDAAVELMDGRQWIVLG